VVRVPHATGHPVELAPEAAVAYERLRAHALAAGFDPKLFTIVSGFRSDVRQAELYKAALERYHSEKEARKMVAPPGHSVHRSGRAIDFWLGINNKKANIPKLRQTEAWKWLTQHAGFFGFSPYPVEPWHWEFNPKQE
jgi:D-alanyl-D-alanine carboxypeptidase